MVLRSAQFNAWKKPRYSLTTLSSLLKYALSEFVEQQDLRRFVSSANSYRVCASRVLREKRQPENRARSSTDDVSSQACHPWGIDPIRRLSRPLRPGSMGVPHVPLYSRYARAEIARRGTCLDIHLGWTASRSQIAPIPGAHFDSHIE